MASRTMYMSPCRYVVSAFVESQTIEGSHQTTKEAETYFAMLRVEEINGRSPKELHNLAAFENLTPLHPNQRVILETGTEPLETRVIDLVAPDGIRSASIDRGTAENG